MDSVRLADPGHVNSRAAYGRADGQVELTAMFYNANRAGRMVMRSKQDIQALKARADQTVASK